MSGVPVSPFWGAPEAAHSDRLRAAAPVVQRRRSYGMDGHTEAHAVDHVLVDVEKPWRDRSPSRAHAPAPAAAAADGPEHGATPRRHRMADVVIHRGASRRRSTQSDLGGHPALAKKRIVTLSTHRVRVHNAISFLACLAVALQVVDVELYTRYDRGGDRVSVILRGLVSLCSAATVLLILVKTFLRHRAMRMENRFYRHTNIFSAGIGWIMLAEMATCAVHCPPLVRFHFTVEQVFTEEPGRYNESVLALAVFLRLYVLSKTLRDYSIVYRKGARLLNRGARVKLTLSYVFRASMDRHPLATVCGVLLGAMLVIAYWLLIFERPYADKGYGYQSALWNTFISMTTVGFGDIFPKSYMGRAVLAVGIAIGLTLFAFLTGFIVEKARLGPRESAVVAALASRSSRKQYREAAATLVQTMWRWHRAGRGGLGIREDESHAVEERATGAGGGGAGAAEVARLTALVQALRAEGASGADVDELRRELAEVGAGVRALLARRPRPAPRPAPPPGSEAPGSASEGPGGRRGGRAGPHRGAPAGSIASVVP
eukprot:tig00021537_g22285.t1